MKKEDNSILNKTLSCEDFCAMYGEIKDSLYRYALYRLGNPEDAEDAVAESVMAAWKSKGSLKDTAAFSGWIFAILRNICNTAIKRMIKDREKMSKAERSTMAASGNAGYEPASLSKELSEALSILDEDEREIVILSVVAGLRSSEISELTGLTAGSVRSKLSRSLSRMRAFLS